MIYSTRLTTNGDTLVFTSSSTGAPVGGSVVAQDNAITNIIVCNTETPNLTDETVGAATLTLNLLTAASPSSSVTNTIVKELTIPAGETVFFSEERIVLQGSVSYGADMIKATASVGNRLSITVSALPV
jgi:hypothetical protein